MFNRFPILLELGAGANGRWRLWALFAGVCLIASIGTWVSGQYKIGRLDALKSNYSDTVINYAKAFDRAPKHSLERDLLDGCKQTQIGTWLQTTDALNFRGPVTGNRVDVSLDPSKAYLDLNGRELASCVQSDIEDMQFDIGSMVNTWSVILLLVSFSIGVWSWICYAAQAANISRGRNVYAERLAETVEETEAVTAAMDADPASGSDASPKPPTDEESKSHPSTSVPSVKDTDQTS